MTSASGGTRPRLDDRQKLDWLRLIRSENVGPVTFRALINRFGGAREAIAALPELSARGGLKRGIRICSEAEAEAEIAEARRVGAHLVALGEPDYPNPLAHAEGSPPLLYVAGQTATLSRPMIAIVGARNCSAAGARIVQNLASDLGAAGLVVISGLARGIDTAAHRASLDSGTVAVLAGGHGRVYPPENDELFNQICSAGAVVSEMPPDWVPRGKDFPRRNRIISGASCGVIVVEAATRSGSLITARFALEQGREVFAVPGSPLDPRAEGTNRLIRQGATLVSSAEDILEVLRPVLGTPVPETPLEEPERLTPTPSVDPAGRQRVIDALGPSPVQIDEIIRHTGLPPSAVLEALMELELAGRLARHPGQRVSLL